MIVKVSEEAVEAAFDVHRGDRDFRSYLRAVLAAAAPHIAADAVDDLARDIYNAPPDPEFPQRQSFYNEGVSPWLESRARQMREKRA